jgi:hypothetical protein
MQKISAIALAIGLSVSAFGVAQAAPGHGGSHGGGVNHSSGSHFGGGGHFGGHGHGGRHGGGHYGGGYHHGHGYYGYGLGLGFGLGLGAYYDSPYWNSYDAYDYPDDDGGDYSDAGPPPPDGNVPPPPPDSTGPGGTPYWYHCSNPNGYYPYVKTCRNWEPVPATPPQNSGN